MPMHEISFWFCSAFLLGIFLISTASNFTLVFLIAILLSVYFIFYKKYYFAIFALLIILGAFYFRSFDFIKKQSVSLPRSGEFSGIITKTEKSATKQNLIVKLEKPYSGKIKIMARRYPEFNYGDLIGISGVIKDPTENSRNYYLKEGISGTMEFPKLSLKETGQGNFIKAFLLEFKNNIIQSFKRLLPAQKAALLSGLTLGEREEFSKDFTDKMSLSGTTHLVALSGYNISVITIAMGAIFGLFFGGSVSFYLTVLAVILFTLMAGAEASIVRAAIMGVIALLAKETQRLSSVRNAIAISAFLMVIFNPRVLAFDLGFQLSFAALLGIIYLPPVLKRIFKIKDEGIFSWKENAVTTVSAQFAVVPLLLGSFGVFSLTSFFANILILSAVPVTMGLGFLMAGLAFFSDFLAGIIGFAVNILLSYEIFIIDLFSRISIPFTVEGFGFAAALIYYLILIIFIYKFNR